MELAQQLNPAMTQTTDESWTQHLTTLASNRAALNNIMNKAKWVELLLKHDVFARRSMLENVVKYKSSKGSIAFANFWALASVAEMQSYWANQLWPHLSFAFPSTTFELERIVGQGEQGGHVDVSYILPKGLGRSGTPFINVDWDHYCSNFLESLQDAREFEDKVEAVERLMGDEMLIRKSMLSACKNGKSEGLCFMEEALGATYFTQILQPHLCKVIPMTEFEQTSSSSGSPSYIGWRILNAAVTTENAGLVDSL